MGNAELFRLVYVAEAGPGTDRAEGVPRLGVSRCTEGALDALASFKVLADCSFAFGHDEDNFGDACGQRFIDAILDERTIDDREHLLGYGLRRGEHASAEAGGENDSGGN